MTTAPAHLLNMLKFSTGLNALSLTQFGGGDSFDKFSVVLTGARIRQALTPSNVAARRLIRPTRAHHNTPDQDYFILESSPPLPKGLRRKEIARLHAEHGVPVYDFKFKHVSPNRIALNSAESPKLPIGLRRKEIARLRAETGGPVYDSKFTRVNPSDLVDLRYAAIKRKRPSFDTPEINAARQVEQGKRLFGLDLDLFPTSPSKKIPLQSYYDVGGKKKYYYNDVMTMQPPHSPSRPDGRLPMVEVGIGHKSLLDKMQDRDLRPLPTVENPLFSGRPDLQDRVDRYVRAAGRYIDYENYVPGPLARFPANAEFPYVRRPLSPQDAVDRLRDAEWSFGNRIR